jgi:methylthioribose-1-phosphate isomerase
MIHAGIPQTVGWLELPDGPVVTLIDQTLLPNEERILHCATVPQVCEAIKSLRVRGAPAIGCAAALGMALAAARSWARDIGFLRAELQAAREALAATRPTAVNLFWALERMAALLGATDDPAKLRELLKQEALAICADDLERCRRIGRHGAELIPPKANVLTHCNAGALATAGYGTALGVIRAAFERHGDVHVWVDETRPLLQGARLTAYELSRDGIPCTVICDNMAAWVMRQGRVDCCVVGADRIAANGDTANKIGTYGLAVLAHHHGVPFYVAAPFSTVDFSLPDGSQIPIEERDPYEVSHLAGLSERSATPEGVPIYSPAFDVTPAELIAGIITENGVARPPFEESLRALKP